MRATYKILLLTVTPILVALFVWQAVGDTSVSSLPLAMTFGFLAGLILNIMPCVLPVVGIKIHSLMRQAGQDLKRTRNLGLAFAAGMLFVFVILGLLAAFANLGWGQAFQSDTFLVTLIVILVALALETFGVYSIRLPMIVSRAADAAESREGLTGSFAKGMLATVLATPCGAPLLGATLSYALRQSPPITLIVFLAVGIGMAFPYVILTWNPKWLALLPRSGPWMNVFREITGFLILATAVWLLWQRRFDGELVVQTVLLCLFVSFSAWLYGRMTAPSASSRLQLVAPFATVFMLSGGAFFCFCLMSDDSNVLSESAATAPPIKTANSVVQESEDQDWQLFRQASLDEFVNEGQSVMVMWTADW